MLPLILKHLLTITSGAEARLTRAPRLVATCLAAASLALATTSADAQSAVPVGSPGLTADYYRGYFYDTLSFFTTHAPVIRNRVVEQLNFAEAETDNFGVGSLATYYRPGNPDEFSARFQGQLYITTAGQYTFYLGSDDAAYLWLDNNSQPLAVNKGDSFPFREVSGTCVLAPGLHRIRVDYGEHGGSQGLVVKYSAANMPKQLLPNGVLYSQSGTLIHPTLTRFEVTADKQQVNLEWETDTEESCAGFVVQKSTDGLVFSDLVRQPGAAAAGPHRYAAIDRQPANGWNYYRVQQLRSDRPPIYSPIKMAEIKPVPFEFSIYPVPNNGMFSLNIQPSNIGTAYLEIIDMSGRPVFHQYIKLADGATQHIEPHLNTTGLYMLQLTTSAGKFTKRIALGI